jgi:hypothetical protein
VSLALFGRQTQAGPAAATEVRGFGELVGEGHNLVFSQFTTFLSRI